VNASAGGKPVNGPDGAAKLRSAMRRAASTSDRSTDSSAEIAEVINNYQATLLRTTGSSLLEGEDVVRIASILAVHSEVEDRAMSRRLLNRSGEVRKAIGGPSERAAEGTEAGEGG
jgi:hypothetical protein